MSRKLVNEVKMQPLQQSIPGLESDSLSDFNFYLGDMNYRLMTTFADLNNTNVRNYAVRMTQTHD